jgi:Tol biopolymer transport system component
LIQEIWWKDLISGESDQLTLLNAFNSHPVSKEGKLYFVSNRGGAYHIWKQRLKEKGGAAVQLTHGDTTDTSPAPLQNGELLFIRHINGRDHLMLKTLSGGEKELPLERKYFKLRQLKVNRCKN